jgi:hypothetical protein
MQARARRITTGRRRRAGSPGPPISVGLPLSAWAPLPL